MLAPIVLLIFDSVENVQMSLPLAFWCCNRTLSSSDVLGYIHSYPGMYVVLSLDISETDRWKHLPEKILSYMPCA